MKNFGREGLDILLRILNESYDHNRHGEVDNKIRHEIIRCLKAFMNDKVLLLCMVQIVFMIFYMTLEMRFKS